VLSKNGLHYYFKGERGVCCKANVQKLLAYAYFLQNHDLYRAETLLNHAKTKFEQLQIFHGLAVVTFAKAHFFFTKSTQFVDEDRNEDVILKEALEECKEAISYYDRIRHRVGHAQSLKLETQIQQKLRITLTRAE